MSRTVAVEADKVAHARSLCERGLWPQVVDFAPDWQMETHGDARAPECVERALSLDLKREEAQLHRARAAPALGRRDILQAACETPAILPLEKFKRMR